MMLLCTAQHEQISISPTSCVCPQYERWCDSPQALQSWAMCKQQNAGEKKDGDMREQREQIAIVHKLGQA